MSSLGMAGILAVKEREARGVAAFQPRHGRGKNEFLFQSSVRKPAYKITPGKHQWFA
jgi:hypothetical protein